MATSQSTIDYLLDVLSLGPQVRVRKMFGEYCLYLADRPIGLVCDNQLYLKPSARGRQLMDPLQEAPPFPGARPHLQVSPDAWEDRAWLQALVRASFDALPPPALPRSPRSKREAQPSATPAKSRSHQERATIASLDNLGPKSQDMLAAAGVHTVAQLRKLGAVPAYARVKALWPRASLNLLWALEGALTDLPWQVVAREHRTSLLLALEQHQQQGAAAPRRSS